jgi:hypothetical protein
MNARTLVRHPFVAAVIGAAAVGVPAPTPVPMFGSLPDFHVLVQHHGPAVVNVSVRAAVTPVAHPGMPPGFDEDNPLFHFFNLPMPRGDAMPMRGDERRSAAAGVRPRHPRAPRPLLRQLLRAARNPLSYR